MLKSELSPQRLREVLYYNPETGLFIWAKQLANRRKTGSVAGYTGKKKQYVTIRIDGHLYAAHQLSWLYVHGKWPVRHVDHINGNKSDNRLCNLREATDSQNVANSRLSKANTTGFKGVCFDKRRSKYKAEIMKNRKTKFLGYFETAEEAHIKYIAAAEIMFGEFARAS